MERLIYVARTSCRATILHSLVGCGAAWMGEIGGDISMGFKYVAIRG